MEGTPGADAGEARRLIDALEHRLVEQKRTIESQRELIDRLQDDARTAVLLRRAPAFRILHRIRGLRRRLLGGPGHLRQHPPRALKLPPIPVTASGPLDRLPVISVVTPNLDGVDFLEATLTSVLGQGYPALEYIVQDGGSRDGSRELIERYTAKLHHVGLERDRGRTHAVNLGFEKSSGEIMAWLSSDDLLLPGSLHWVGRYFLEHPEVDALYGHRILIDQDGMEIGRWVLPRHDDAILSWADYVPQESLFWRRSLWERVDERLDESFRFALDWDLLLRFRDAGARIVRVPHFLGAFRVHPAQQSSSQIHTVGAEEMTLLRERCHGRVVDPREIDRACVPYLLRASVHRLMHRVGIRGM